MYTHCFSAAINTIQNKQDVCVAGVGGDIGFENPIGVYVGAWILGDLVISGLT